MINLCITTFNRQDLLGRTIRSAFEGSIVPDRVFIVDQAARPDVVRAALDGREAEIIDLGEKRGCEASAINWYLTNVPEERVIAHDDVEFGPQSLEQFVAAQGAFLIDEAQGVITYRDAAIRAVGLYDTEMSPNHFRYVDADYEERLGVIGIEPVVVACGVKHTPGGTIRGYTPEQMMDHHARFGYADAFYTRKWGRSLTPGMSTIGRSNWRKQHGIGVSQ